MDAYETGEMFGRILVSAIILFLAVGGVAFCIFSIRKAMKGGGGGWIAGAIVSGFVAVVGAFAMLGLVVSMVATPMIKSAAAGNADTVLTSEDGTLSLTIPGNWKKSGSFSEGAEISAEGPLQMVCAMLMRDLKEDFAGNLSEFDELTVSTMEEALKGVKVSDAEHRQIDGYPAIYRRITGQADNLNIVYHRLSVETADSFLQMLVWTTPSREASERATMTRVMESFKCVAGPPQQGQ